MRKIKNIIMFCCIFIAAISFMNVVNADTTDEIDTSEQPTVMTTTQQMVQDMNTGLSMDNDVTKGSSIIYLLSRLFTAIQFIGTGISIVVITRLAITYIMSSVEEKAQIKQRAVPILFGSFVLVATVNILKFIQVFVTN